MPCIKVDYRCKVIDHTTDIFEVRIMTTIGVDGSLLLFAITGFHIYWFFGGTLGSDRYTPPEKNGTRVIPSKPIILATSFVFLIAALIPLIALRIIVVPLPELLVNAGLVFGIVVLSIRGIGGFFWSILQPKPRDIFHRWNIILYTPLCLFLALAYLVSFFSYNSLA